MQGRDNLPRVLALAVVSGTGAALAPSAVAQSVPEFTTTRVKFSYYNDSQPSGDRITVRSPMVWVNAPLNEVWEIEAGGVLDTVSGASPFYLDTLSGASGRGIEDNRAAGDVKLTRYFDGWAFGFGGAYSDEDDYRSRNALAEARFWNDDRTRTYTVGLARDWDQISSTNNQEIDERRQTMRYLAGVTQIIDPNSFIQMNITLASGDGYHSDPYKIFDRRPRSRDEWAWLTRYVRYLNDTGGSLHLDYRLYRSSWDVTSHMLEARVFHPVANWLTIRPGIRYYTQDEARFFSDTVPPASLEGFTSSDQRLSTFGSVTGGLKAIFHITDLFDLDLMYEYMYQDRRLSVQGGDDDIQPLRAHYIEVGITKRF